MISDARVTSPHEGAWPGGDGAPLVEALDVRVWFPNGRTAFGFGRPRGYVKAVDGVSLAISPHETLGVVGESGSGKTTLARAIAHLPPPTGGKVFLKGTELGTLSRSELRRTRRDMQFIFQDPYGSLDPRMTVGDTIGEPLKIHKTVHSTVEYNQRVTGLMDLVGLSGSMSRRYPHEFSGGQRQRIGIARALALNPSLVICDEPVSSLDVSIQAQILNLLEDLQAELGLTYLFIAHDLAVVREIADRISVMYLGHVVETAPAAQLYENPRHPYTRALLSAVPVPDPEADRQRERIVLKGEIPSPSAPPSGCVFHTRCPIAIDACKTTIPVPVEIGPGHTAACIRLDE